jgi:hypothetical protein
LLSTSLDDLSLISLLWGEYIFFEFQIYRSN